MPAFILPSKDIIHNYLRDLTPMEKHIDNTLSAFSVAVNQVLTMGVADTLDKLTETFMEGHYEVFSDTFASDDDREIYRKAYMNLLETLLQRFTRLGVIDGAYSGYCFSGFIGEDIIIKREEAS